jgi:hypothetical protein
MNRRARIVLTVLMMFGLLAPPAGAAVPTPQQLQKKITALTQKVTKLERRLNDLEQLVLGNTIGLSCLQLVSPISQYGGFANEGYVYAVGQNLFIESALDLVPDTTGLVPGTDFAWIPEVDPACVSTQTRRASETTPNSHPFIPRPASDWRVLGHGR